MAEIKLDSKKESIKEKYNQEGQQEDRQPTREELHQHYKTNLSFMKLQNEFEEHSYQIAERRVKGLELHIREIDARSKLLQYKQEQDSAQERNEEEKLKANWDAMSDEEKAEWVKKAEENLAAIDKQTEEATKDAEQKDKNFSNTAEGEE